MRNILVPFFLVSGSLPAFAHPGHLGEVAGHGHWLALGALLAAAALAALLAKMKANTNEDEDAEGEDAEEEQDAEPAGA